MVTYRKLKCNRDILVKAKIPQESHNSQLTCNRPKTYQYCPRMSKSGSITNTQNNIPYYTMIYGNFQSNNLMNCLECNIWKIMFVGQTNRVMDRFKGHICDKKNHKNTTAARHFASHGEEIHPFNIYILEYIPVSKDTARSVYHGPEGFGLKTQVKYFNPQWPKYHRLRC